MSQYWHRSAALCCACGTLRAVSPRYRGGYGGEREEGWRCLSWLKCATCGTQTRHADLLEAGTPFRDDHDAPNTTPYTLASRVMRLAEDVEFTWVDGENGPAVELRIYPDEPWRSPRAWLSRTWPCAAVLAALEQAEQLVRDPDWRTTRIAWTVETYRWAPLNSGGLRIALVGGLMEEGPEASAAERLIEERRAGT
ncbi:MAG: DUF6315 family protein [Nocardioidaceae bacterium]